MRAARALERARASRSRTAILATFGPATDAAGLLEELVAPRIVVTVEAVEAVDALGPTLAVTDAAMVPRGDLGVQVGVARVPAVQRSVVHACRAAGRPAVMADPHASTSARAAMSQSHPGDRGFRHRDAARCHSHIPGERTGGVRDDYPGGMTIPLSVLDLAPVPDGVPASRALHNTLHLAEAADRLGYTRYWLAEHHNLPAMACPSPEVMIGQVAARTTRIRVGSGGVMLPNHSPLRIAETFRLLEGLYPGRIDLGIGRAPGTDGVTAYALRRGMHSAEDTPDLLAELMAFAGGGFPGDHPFRMVTAEPRDVPLPPVYLLGSSDYGARLAARLGLGFAFARHMNPRAAEEVMHLYREQFVPSEHRAEPHAILAVSAIAADTDERAEELVSSMGLAVLRMRLGWPSPLPTPDEALGAQYSASEEDQIRRYRRAQIVGTADAVRDEIAALADVTAADEAMVMTMVHSHDERVRSYELLAAAAGLPAAEPAAAGAA